MLLESICPMCGCEYSEENNYIEKMINAINIHEETKEQFNEILNIANTYIEKE